MADVINLNKQRKRRARAAEAVEAARNRVTFGRTAAQKKRDAAVAEDAARRMEQLRREPEDP
jgi:hypothetical protein